MSSQSDRLLKLQITAKSDRPELLTGLDAWLQLGLIEEWQVRQLCRTYLTCPLPEPVAIPTPAAPETILPPPVTSAPQPAAPPPQPSFLTQVLQSLMAELSVRWLLFLGVFLVVVSSGVLAASQWERFPAAGQYGVLAAYTLIFWAISLWASRQPNLALTAQTLRLVTLLLVPVNFWAMDTFGLWQTPWNWLVLGVAAISLTWMTSRLFGSRHFPESDRDRKKLPLWNHLSLSYLHWGWSLPFFPLVAVYLGIVGTAFLTISQTLSRQAEVPGENLRDRILFRKSFFVVYALAILLVRAIFVARVEITQLGLALAICGALLAWLDRQPQPETETLFGWKWEVIGGGLIGLGWLVCVVPFPLQALAVSALGFWFFASRLFRGWRKVDLLLLFLTGLQAIFLSWRLIPDPIQQSAIAFLTQLTSSTTTLWALLSLVLFPYLILTVSFSDWLYRHRQQKLAQFGEGIALCFGTLLSAIATINPLIRTLNLLASTIVLGTVTQRYLGERKSTTTRKSQVSLVYFTHILGLFTLSSGIDWFFPHQNPEIWAAILLGMMVVEWAFSLTEMRTTWQQSAWYLGFALAGISYLIIYNLCTPVIAENLHPGWCAIWIITPLALTGISTFSRTRRQLASQLSIGTLGSLLLIVLEQPENRLIALGIGFILMLVNTRNWQDLISAAIAVGFGLSFLVATLAQGFLGFPTRSPYAWLIAGAITLTILWLIRHYLNRLSISKEVSNSRFNEEK